MITTKTENIPLSMKEGSASYFCFVCLSIRGICYGAAYGSVLFLAGFVAVFGLPILLVDFLRTVSGSVTGVSLTR